MPSGHGLIGRSPVVELRVLRYFVAVADAGSVTAGSAASHVSQPAVSRQLRALERELGVELLVRSEGGVRLTAAGAELLVLAYARAERSGSVSWEDLNEAYRAALCELGGQRTSQLVELAALADSES